MASLWGHKELDTIGWLNTEVQTDGKEQGVSSEIKAGISLGLKPIKPCTWFHEDEA